MVISKPELLAPAGDFEKLKFAFAYGADAVYLGLPMFSLRTRENRFDLDSVRQGIEYAHARGKRVYITANIYAHNVKIGPFIEAMDQVVPLGADAYIMSDPGLIDLIRERHPGLVIHLSTQANNTNWAQVRFWQRQGIRRVILGRELNMDEICDISTRCPDVETEVFVHGAMCMAYSGRCLLSDFMTGRPSNSGACTQSCRWQYKPRASVQDKPSDYQPPVERLSLDESKRPDKPISVEEDEYGSYIFNSKDLCALELLPKIIDTGVCSMKIEGRNKNFLYLATVVRIYRRAIDACFDGRFEAEFERLRDELATINRRGYTLGFLAGQLSDSMNYEKIDSATRELGGMFVRMHDDGCVEVRVRSKISVGDEIEWVTPDRGILKQRIERIVKLSDVSTYDASWDVPTISGGQKYTVKIPTPYVLDEFCLLRTIRRL